MKQTEISDKLTIAMSQIMIHIPKSCSRILRFPELERRAGQRQIRGTEKYTYSISTVLCVVFGEACAFEHYAQMCD